MRRYKASSAVGAAARGGIIVMAAALFAVTLLSAAPARAQGCPGNPDAIGTSRVLTLTPGEVTRVGRMQYPETLPLNDHEVVLTFDDGPLPPYSDRILDILASQCVKATYFMIGSMARQFPAVARRVHAAGHTIGTHSENHPVGFGKLPIQRMRSEIDDGIADVGAALGDPSELAPFFRIPGLARSDRLESELAARSLVVFSADVVADDWHRRIKPDQIIARALSRLEANGRGILLLHDIHPATVAALPGLLAQLKAHGFRIVQLVPAILTEPEMMARTMAPTVAWTLTGQEAAAAASSGPVQWPNVGFGPIDADNKLPAADEDSFAVGYALTPAISNGDIEAGVVIADAAGQELDRSLPGPIATTPWPDSTMQNVGLPIEPPRLVAEALETKSTPEAAGALGHAKLRRHEFHVQRTAAHAITGHGAHAPPSYSGWRADLLPQPRALAAMAATARSASNASQNF